MSGATVAVIVAKQCSEHPELCKSACNSTYECFMSWMPLLIALMGLALVILLAILIENYFNKRKK